MSMLILTNEELQLFCDGFREVATTSLSLKEFKDIFYKSGNGVLCDILSMKFEDLPLYINYGRSRMDSRGASAWYKKCIEIRLLIGR